MDEPISIGDWTRVGDLGAGAFGKVSLWKNKLTNEFYAVKKCKVLMKENLTPRQRERWRNEVDIMKTISHENIVSFKSLPDLLLKELNKYNPSELPILSMEYCTKGNLRNHLRTPKNIKGLQECEVRYILNDISSAIAYLHNMGITHRDLKPENIVLQEYSARPINIIYKVIDLGYAKELSSLGLSFVGTLPYLAPEIFRTEKYDKTVDYWSFGITVYEVITGELPFLPYLTPIERFEYIKQKSEDDICIWLTPARKPYYSKEILANNFITSTLKKHLEKWLRLVLQFEPGKRGIYRGQRKDVIEELRMILSKKIIKVFSIYNFMTYSFEISNDTTFEDVKVLLEAGALIPKDEQILFYKNQENLCCDEDIVMDCLQDINHLTELYMFRKNEFIDPQKQNSLPKQLDVLFTGPPIQKKDHLRVLFLVAINYTVKQNYTAELFKRSLMALFESYKKPFDSQWILYHKIRQNMIQLSNKVECYEELNSGLLDKENVDNEKNLKYLSEYRVLLRQIKELTENFNGMTERFLKLNSGIETMSELIEIIKKTLDKININEICDHLIKLVKNITMENIPMSSTELKKTLSKVLKVFSESFLTNKNIGDFLKNLSKAYYRLTKLEKCIIALDKEIYRLSNEVLVTQTNRLKLISSKVVSESANNSSLCVSLPVDIQDSLTETESLLQENLELRYMIQDKINENFAGLRAIQKELLLQINGATYTNHCIW